MMFAMAVGGGDCSTAGRGLRAEVDPAGTAEIYTLDVGRWAEWTNYKNGIGKTRR